MTAIADATCSSCDGMLYVAAGVPARRLRWLKTDRHGGLPRQAEGKRCGAETASTGEILNLDNHA